MSISGNKTKIIAISIVVFMTLLAWFSVDNGSILFYMTFLSVAFLLIVRNYEQSSDYKKLYLLLLIVHVCLLFYQVNFRNLPMCGGDWGVYVEVARELLLRENALFDIVNPLTFGEIKGDMYERLCAFVYYFYGYQQKYMYFLSFIATESAFFNIYRSARIIVGKNDSKLPFYSALVFYFTPLEMVYSVDFLREMIIQAIFSLSLYYFVKYIYRISNNYLPVIALSLVLCIFHSGFIGVLAGYIAVFFLMNRVSRTLVITFPRMILLVTVLTLVYISPLWNLIAARFSDVGSIGDLSNRVNYSSKFAVGSTDYISAPGTSLGVILQTPIRFIYYLISPLPWQVFSVGTAIAMVLDGSIRWLLCYRIIRLLIHAKRNQLINYNCKLLLYSALVIIGCTTLIFSWGTNNYGTAMRHRTSLYPLEILLYVTVWHMEYVGMNKNEKKRRG